MQNLQYLLLTEYSEMTTLLIIYYEEKGQCHVPPKTSLLRLLIWYNVILYKLLRNKLNLTNSLNRNFFQIEYYEINMK